ncbi:MAG: N-acetyltransferase [Anaerolineae bacterium]|nr:N-acetyltransferase [Anaerolineae bacterium]
MTDMLVKLYALPPLPPELDRQTQQGVTLRRGLPPEKHLVADWVAQHFSLYWRSEAEIAFHRQPVSFFGPTGVAAAARGRGTGRALLLACLHDMRAQGYGYAIIGAVGPVDFYAQHAGATLIPDSTPGIYAGLLRVPPRPEPPADA